MKKENKLTLIEKNYEIKNDTTFKIGGCIEEIALPSSAEDFVNLIQSKNYDMVLGNCSNVLFQSDFIQKKIILTKNLKDFRIEDDNVYVSAGTRGTLISKECKKHSLSGFEFMIGFPGSFGGMICMNASAHFQAIADTFISARVYDLKEDKIKVLTKEDMHFDYRKSILSDGNYIVLDANFKLKYDDSNKIEEKMNKNLSFRKEKQPPLTFGNAGSIFKNPDNNSAGKLIDSCGFRGVIKGGAKVYDKHANFIINYNNATSSDVINLMFEIYSKVKENYKIELKPEIKYIGNKGTDEYKLWEIMSNENIL